MKCEKVESPFKLEIRIGIGNCFYKKDDFRNATSTFVLLHQENPQNIPVMINLAACYIMRLKYRDAIKIFEKCRALEPENWEICSARAPSPPHRSASWNMAPSATRRRSKPWHIFHPVP